MDRLQEKIALITGAARGLGLAIGRRFRDEGATVVVNDLDAGAAERAAAGSAASAWGGRLGLRGRRPLARVGERYGRLDVL
jgi:NAD(P)-dependent dehydrogenase (short-subunit alcohol dehydrogenase family)